MRIADLPALKIVVSTTGLRTPLPERVRRHRARKRALAAAAQGEERWPFCSVNRSRGSLCARCVVAPSSVAYVPCFTSAVRLGTSMTRVGETNFAVEFAGTLDLPLPRKIRESSRTRWRRKTHAGNRGTLRQQIRQDLGQ